MNKVAIVYLGKRGGGASIFRDLAHLFVNEGLFVFLVFSRRLENEYEYSAPNQSHEFKIPEPNYNLGLLFRIFSLPFFGFLIGFKLKRAGVTFAVFPMASPFDAIVQRIFKWFGIYTVRIIHDDAPHLGDRWPTRRKISNLVTGADFLCFLSGYVARKFSFRKGIVCEFPPIYRKSSRKYEKLYDVCVVGRGSEYKGLEIFKQIVLETKSRNWKYLIAGGIADLFDMEGATNVIAKPGWLSEELLHDLISSSKVLLLPYREATQSGLIPIAKLSNTVVVATPVGGLVEQVSDYKYSVLSQEITSSSLIEALEQAFEGRFDVDKKSIERPSIYDALVIFEESIADKAGGP